jgi:DNA-damage-inducible protein D
MKKELIKELFEKFEQACYTYKNVECWSARELQNIFNYSEWRNFIKVIDKAKESCNNSGTRVSDHFVDSNKMIDLAFAQTCFAVQTRKQELIEQRLLDIERVTAREKLSKSEKKLSGSHTGQQGTGGLSTYPDDQGKRFCY